MNNLTTLSQMLYIARNEADEEDSSILDLTDSGDHASKPAILGDTGIGVIDILALEHQSVVETDVGAIHFMFTGGTAENYQFGWRILAWGNSNYPAKLVAIGTATLGSQAVVKYPHNMEGSVATNKFWADTIVITWENWFKEVEATDTTGHDTCASLWLDAAGHRYWKIEITTTGVTATQATAVSAFYGYW